MILPRYPIYVPSKGRPDPPISTARFLDRDGVPFALVVEPQEADAYIARWGAARVHVLPFRDRGSVIPARNWIKAHATAAGHARHWQLDDNMRYVMRRYRGIRIPCNAGPALASVEDFADRYENVGVAGLNYTWFLRSQKIAPFFLNVHVYSCTLTLNALPFEWRGRYNEDTDYCLQTLAAGWCTVLVNVFAVDKALTMTVGGGNTAALYRGDGRLKMARALERLWPGVVSTDRRWGRPQHRVHSEWKKFDTPLRLKPGVVRAATPDEYGLEMIATRPVQSPELRALYAAVRRERA